MLPSVMSFRLALLLLLGGQAVSQLANEVDFSDGFDCSATGIILNGNRPFPSMVPNGVNDKCTLQLTSDKAEPRAVSAFSALSFDSTALWFESRFRYRIFGSNAGSADGIAFVVHQDERAQAAVGGDGGKLGVYGANIIKPALVIEFDTFKNERGLVPVDEELDAIHVTFIDEDGNVYEVIEQEFDRIRTSPNGGTDQEVLITLVNNQLSVSIDNTPVLQNLCMDLTDGGERGPGFTGDFLFAGFTSSTGLEGDQQEVLLWQFQELIPTPGVPITTPTCPVQVKETATPTPPPVPAPTTSSPVVQPTTASPTSAPTPAPPRQARLLVTVAGTEELDETFIIAFEQSCSLFLSNQDGLPDTTCEVEGQEVTDGSTVILTVLFEAIAPGLDVEEFANLVLAALDDPLFTDPLNVIGSGIGEPVLTAVITLTIDNVQNGQLTPGGIDVLEATCREFLTVRVGNPNIRCTVFQLDPPPNDDGRRHLQGNSPVMIEQISTAGDPSDFDSQPSTDAEWQGAVEQAFSEDGTEFIDSAQDLAEESDVTDFDEAEDVEVMPSFALFELIRILIPIIVAIFQSFGSS